MEDRAVPEPEFETPEGEFRLPDGEPPGPDYSDMTTQPDFVARPPQPPDGPIICDPPLPPEPDQVSREELELALERAKLVADDCATILEPAIQAMQDGAWVSRRADEFSLELEDYAQKAADASQGPVQTIEDALNSRNGGDDDLQLYQPEFRAPMPAQPGTEV